MTEDELFGVEGRCPMLDQIRLLIEAASWFLSPEVGGMGNFQVDSESKTSPTKLDLSKSRFSSVGRQKGSPDKRGL